MKTMNFKQMMRKSAGYTIDQTILIVAVIAILITLIIASVGWDLLNRTSGTKFASYLKQIEESNGAFYARQGVWPHIAVNGVGVTPVAQLPDNYISVLATADSLGGLGAANDYAERWKPYLTGFDVVVNAANSDATVSHEFGAGGIISQSVDVGGIICEDGSNHLLIRMDDVPLTEVVNADEAIDGEIDFAAGRVKYDNATNDTQDVTYCANLLN
ncbi:MAG: hypothetical protein ACI9TY_000414 [Alphaproteobacteria bacterium]|jgi:hypothetical protein